MSNNVHLIIGINSDEKIEHILRDFKKYTSVKLMKEIQQNPQESRKEWLLWMFKKLAEKRSKHQKYCFWQNEYQPIELTDHVMISRKLDYSHQNLVFERLVDEAEHYTYSSARDYLGGRGLINIKFLD